MTTHSDSAGVIGNRCGHDKNALKTTPRWVHKSDSPKLIKAVIKSLECFKRSCHDVEDIIRSWGSNRLMRSERREAIAVTLKIVMKFFIIETGIIGETTKHGKFVNKTMKQLCAHTGLSWSRFRRAWGDLVRRGYIKVTQLCEERGGGEIRALTSIKKVTNKLFEQQGYTRKFIHWLDDERQKRKMERQKKRIGQALKNSQPKPIFADSKPVDAKTASKHVATIRETLAPLNLTPH